MPKSPPPVQPSPVSVPPTARYQEKRDAVLAGAARLFNEEGVRGATLSHIAASVGLVTSSVTYYYRKKEDLATACFLRSIAAFDALATRAWAQVGAAARVRAFYLGLTGLLADIAEGRHPPLVSFNDIRALPPTHADEVFAAYTDMFRRTRGLLKAPDTAALSRDDLNARAHIVLSVAHWMRAWIDRHEVDHYPRVAERVTDLVLHGIAAPGVQLAAADASPPWALGREVAGTSEAFLRAATMLVNEQGYRGASVDKISARLNLTKGSFYHHHDHKDDLISACFERSFAVMRQALKQAELAPGSGWQRACGAARALVHYQLSPDGPLLRTTATSALPDRAHRGRVRTTMQQLGERLTGVLVDGMMDGSIRPLDPAIAAQGVIATINAAAELHRWLPGVDAAHIDALYVRPMLEGVLCEQAGAGASAPAG